ncbi:MAG: PEGA domain-containing protein [Deltaproteobacteria bacterium]|nr:PEGA domain-containing protein [Deltaproteobacteria bacterium]
MSAWRNIMSLAVALALALLAGRASAQQPVQVNKSGTVSQGTEVKDENGKPMRLRRGESVTVFYQRSDWYWVKNRKGQLGWVDKKYIKLGGDEDKQEKPEPATKSRASKKHRVKKTPSESSKAEVAKAEEAKAEVAKAEEAKVEEAKAETKTESKSDQTEMVVAANTGNLGGANSFKPMASNKQDGLIDVFASESGARVSVDGRELGAAPLRGVQLPGGTHVVSVQKPGFLPSNAQVEIDGGTSQVALALVPTAQTRGDYEGGTWLWRTIGFSGLGLGAGVVLAGLGMGGWGLAEAGTVRKDIDNYNRSESRTESEREELLARRDGAQLKFLVGQVSLISGLALAGVGVVAYMLSDDPDRYDVYGDIK